MLFWEEIFKWKQNTQRQTRRKSTIFVSKRIINDPLTDIDKQTKIIYLERIKTEIKVFHWTKLCTNEFSAKFIYQRVKF